MHKVTIDNRDAKTGRVKMTIDADNGTRYVWWPYLDSKLTDKEVVAAAVVHTDQIIAGEAQAIANMPVAREEIDDVLSKLKEANVILVDNWDDLKAAADAVRVSP